jgi:flagellin-like protein
LNSLYRKIRKNSKALSPVVASIILIAVTVAVSVVVAAWMGGTTIGLMGNAEQASIANIAFTDNTGTADQITVLVQNSGTTTVNVTQAYINGVVITGWTPQNEGVDKSSAKTYTLTLNAGSDQLVPGTAYQVKLITAKGNQLQNSATFYP